MTNSTQWQVLGKYLFSYLHLCVNYRFNAIHIPQHDDTLNSTSRRYGTKTEPFTHPANHSKYPPNETTFRASFINPKRQPSSVFRSRDPQQEFSNEVTIRFQERVTDKTNLNGPR